MIFIYRAFFVECFLVQNANFYIKHIKMVYFFKYVFLFDKIYELNNFKNTLIFNTFIKKFQKHYELL